MSTPSQAEKNMPDDYGRELRRQAKILAEKKALAEKEKKALEEKKEESKKKAGNKLPISGNRINNRSPRS